MVIVQFVTFDVMVTLPSVAEVKVGSKAFVPGIVVVILRDAPTVACSVVEIEVAANAGTATNSTASTTRKNFFIHFLLRV